MEDPMCVCVVTDALQTWHGKACRIIVPLVPLCEESTARGWIRDQWCVAFMFVCVKPQGVVKETVDLTQPTLMPHIYISELGKHWLSDGLAPMWRKAIIKTNDGLLSIDL